ncbi:MAG: DUF378 domain-containing protein [Oscillospiraceae bacterium]|jgi:uncharacterized membrane protein YuzA (DUF378 family)|nr:DUF378 domain-containing protein [Oscillospiraceae bacterium]
MSKFLLFLLILGGLNMGSIGLFQFDVISWSLGGPDSLASRIAYSFLAACGIWCLSFLFPDEKNSYAKIHRRRR